MTVTRMPFGMHKGKLLDEIPPDYLHWVLANCSNLTVFLRREIERVLSTSTSPIDSRDQARSIVRTVFRELAHAYHPDHGGNNAAMAALIAFYDRLNVELAKLA